MAGSFHEVALRAAEAAETVQGHCGLSAGTGRAEWRAWLLAGSGKGWWRLAGSPQAAEAMSLAWFREQGLVALTARYTLFEESLFISSNWAWTGS